MTNFFDKIEPRGWIGSGGFGSVYEASDGPVLVAVKMIQLKPKTREKQLLELEMHLLFDHQNIVHCFAGFVSTRGQMDHLSFPVSTSIKLTIQFY